MVQKDPEHKNPKKKPKRSKRHPPIKDRKHPHHDPSHPPHKDNEKPKEPEAPEISEPPLPPYYFNPYNPAPPPKSHLPPPKPKPYIVPPLVKSKPKSRPHFTPPKPKYVYPIPHRPPPFPPVPEKHKPSIYKPTPNQPLGLIPPHAIPFWKPKPKDANYLPITPPPAPKKPKGKWMPYFYYPIPFKHKKNKNPVYKPQYVFVPKKYKPAKKKPESVPVYITPPLEPHKKNDYPERYHLYKMPVLTKPIDPQIRGKLKHRKKMKKVRKERKKRNKKMKENPKYRPRTCKEKEIFCRRTEMRNLKANKDKELRKIDHKCSNASNKEICNKVHKNQLFVKHPEYTTDYPDIPIYNPTKFKFLGFKKKCKQYYVGVIMNRHFINRHQWKVKDYSFDTGGNIRYCEGWFTAPIFRRIRNHSFKFNTLDNMSKEIKFEELKKEDIAELCHHNLDTILNLKNRKEFRWNRDEVEKQCMLRFGDGKELNAGKIYSKIGNH